MFQDHWSQTWSVFSLAFYVTSHKKKYMMTWRQHLGYFEVISLKWQHFLYLVQLIYLFLDWAAISQKKKNQKLYHGGQAFVCR